MHLLLKTAIPIFILSLILIATRCTDDPFDCDQFQCWDGITPGQTTFDEAVKLLRLFHGKQNVIVYDDGILWSQHHEPFLSGFLSTTNQQTPQSIEIHFQNPRPTVAEMIDILGHPTAVYMLTSGAACDDIRLFHEEHNIILWLNPIQVHEIGRSGVLPEQTIGTLTILSERSASPTFRDTLTRIDWQGYIDYCEFHTPQ